MAGEQLADPPADCGLCPRLVAFRGESKAKNPDWFNGAVASFGDPDARLLIVGLAPGLSGANRTARPFTGDYAGDLLYETLAAHGFSTGTYDKRADDGLYLRDCRITNAVRCVPPRNKPVGAEIKTCRQFLIAQLAQAPRPKTILALGRIAHDSLLTTLELRRADYPFSHGARHDLGDGRALYDSYHCSRYNTNTRRLTPEMFHAVFTTIRAELDQG
ncbi:MAG: uracil-DNA glycosylase [Alphaproteobacteria bacterium]|jgi:uracil-DNA glycosylase family 4|nr:uracil-DNA glycosylase [Alphaproteobacteria bacterium]MDP7055312.1 uracil-DNA glycosylase [Alphaproteobacteria bacterium]MDP7229069.1 uracil-DNA glycosylase [Alphaproteobacteria bacterium]HJM91755.1 uracil-DNA glycosylase [Alphaproteobacteria bacterium]|tara:strand:- start:1280 stop:1930 length:651 start_codon:yes stop_codon:yes gene_type:complete